MQTNPNANVTCERTLTLLLPPHLAPPPLATCTYRINRKWCLCVLMFFDLLLSAYYYYYQWSWWSCAGSDDCSSEHHRSQVLVSSHSFRFVNWTIQTKLKRNYTQSWHSTAFSFFPKDFLILGNNRTISAWSPVTDAFPRGDVNPKGGRYYFAKFSWKLHEHVTGGGGAGEGRGGEGRWIWNLSV